jgi:uncharacterized protein YggE
MKPLVLLLALVTTAVPDLVLAQHPAEESVLRVQGSAEVRVAPDLAAVRLGVAEEARTAQEAQSAVTEAAGAIVDAVRAVGIAERNVQTVRLVLSPVYSPRRPGNREEPRIVGYRASNTVSIRVEDLGSVGQVIDAALEAGANQMERVSFGLQDDRAVRQQALRQAIAEARGKADAMADALDVKLDAIVSVTEDNVSVRQPVMEAARVMALQGGASTSVSPGEVSVSALVSIAYRIE